MTLLIYGIVVTLFDANPASQTASSTPQAQSRPLSPDRPDQLESPLSVEAGRIQIEQDTLSLATSVGAKSPSLTLKLMATNIKVGVFKSVDLQLVVEPIVLIRDEVSDWRAGFGDLQARAKINLVGNDGERFAIGLIPAMIIPSSTHTMGGRYLGAYVSVPMTLELPYDLSLGLMPSMAADPDENGVYGATGFVVVNLNFPIFGPVAAFAESSLSFDLSNRTINSIEVHGGVTWLVTDDLMIDAGFWGTAYGIGEQRSFVGLTWRR